MQIGVMLNNIERDRIAAWRAVADAGFSIVHTNAVDEDWLTGPQRSRYLEAARNSGLTIDTMFIGYDGQDYSNIASIEKTVGLLAVPELRRHRIDAAKRYCDMANELNVSNVAMHLGFMPTDVDSADYQFLIAAVREIADYCRTFNQSLHFETGQESGDELLRFIEAVDRTNIGVNFDCGNFLLYGTDEPLNALRLLGPHVRGVHCKDGFPPTVAGELGNETPLGQGRVGFPQFLQELKTLNFRGPLIMERECGPDARAELLEAKQYLESLLA